MNKTIKVRAVAGALVPDPRRVRVFYGWARCKAEDSPEHTIPTADGGMHFRRVGDVDVPDTSDVRTAIARGELVLAPAETPAEASASKPKKTTA